MLPEGLEKIGVGAFTYSRIERIDLPSSIRSIGAEAFARCVSLLSI